MIFELWYSGLPCCCCVERVVWWSVTARRLHPNAATPLSFSLSLSPRPCHLFDLLISTSPVLQALPLHPPSAHAGPSRPQLSTLRILTIHLPPRVLHARYPSSALLPTACRRVMLQSRLWRSAATWLRRDVVSALTLRRSNAGHGIAASSPRCPELIPSRSPLR